MTFSLLTYNVLFNKAFSQLGKILSKYKPDFLCFQEVDTNEDNLNRLEKYGYKLADYSNSLIKFGKVYGIATYFNPKKIKLIDTNYVNLPKSLLEMISAALKVLKGGSKPRTILRTDFLLAGKSKTVTIYNVHLTLIGINRTRNKQLEIVLNHGLNKNRFPTIITGDFNYFHYSRKKLENLMSSYGYKEATKGINYTFKISDSKFAKYNFFQRLGSILVKKYYNQNLKPDYTFYKKIKLLKTERIDEEFSDHYPIISTFKSD